MATAEGDEPAFVLDEEAAVMNLPLQGIPAEGEPLKGANQKGIGGSECSAILGLNPYMSNVDLWKIKTGKTEQPDISREEHVQFGRENEEFLINKFAVKNSEKYIVEYKPFDIRFNKRSKCRT